MDIKDLINDIVSNDKYKSMCRKKANDDESWKDLYQDFILKILEDKSHANIIKAKNIEVYCYVIICRLWLDRIPRSGYRKKDVSSLYKLTERPEDLYDYFDYCKLNTLTENEKELNITLKNELEKLLTSDSERTKQQGRLLKMFCEGTNRLKISKELGINYKIVHEQIEEAKNKIKFNMTGIQTVTKNDITVKLRAEEAKPSYSGKDKTFYVEKVSEETKQMILKAGFKVEKK